MVLYLETDLKLKYACRNESWKIVACGLLKSGRKRVMGNQTVLKHLMWMGVALPHTMNCGSRWMSEVCVFHILSFSSLQLGAVF